MPTEYEFRQAVNQIETICHNILANLRTHNIRAELYNTHLHSVTRRTFGTEQAHKIAHVIHWALREHGLEYQSAKIDGEDVSQVSWTPDITRPSIHELLTNQYHDDIIARLK